MIYRGGMGDGAPSPPEPAREDSGAAAAMVWLALLAVGLVAADYALKQLR